MKRWTSRGKEWKPLLHCDWGTVPRASSSFSSLIQTKHCITVEEEEVFIEGLRSCQNSRTKPAGWRLHLRLICTCSRRTFREEAFERSLSPVWPRPVSQAVFPSFVLLTSPKLVLSFPFPPPRLPAGSAGPPRSLCFADLSASCFGWMLMESSQIFIAPSGWSGDGLRFSK